MEVLESVSQRTRGDFLRTSVISGCALHQIDKRLPLLIATLFNGNMTPSQLVAIIRQRPAGSPMRLRFVKLWLRSAQIFRKNGESGMALTAFRKKTGHWCARI
ncbi:plasmid partitioning/stability family protein [Erwinia amylovora]|uniref:plasmid partitioning/stability family protein n=1 Tax=Erwinia amylovora TaxID=552 RepID=UPI000C073EF1